MSGAVRNYHRPESLEEALALLDEHGDDARLIAGGPRACVPMNELPAWSRLEAP